LLTRSLRGGCSHRHSTYPGGPSRGCPGVRRLHPQGPRSRRHTGRRDRPRDLEELTTELVGAELYRAIHDAREGLWFGWWFAELADAARSRLDRAAGSDEWRPPFWLLHGLAAIAPPALFRSCPAVGS